jgi:hypothetical protein
MVRTAILLLAGLLLVAAGARTATAGPYGLSWFTVDGGGATALSGGYYALGATAGQADAGIMAGGGYKLAGGFWAGGVKAPQQEHGLYLPVVVRIR